MCVAAREPFDELRHRTYLVAAHLEIADELEAVVN
jgi:hypothetical protein